MKRFLGTDPNGLWHEVVGESQNGRFLTACNQELTPASFATGQDSRPMTQQPVDLTQRTEPDCQTCFPATHADPNAGT